MKTLLFLILFGVGCAASMKKSREQPKESTDLRLIVRDFHQQMRWGLWERASMYMEESQKNEFMGRFDELGEDYKITDLEVKLVTKSGENSNVEVEQQWYHEPNMTLQKDRFIEEWHLGSEGWRLVKRSTKKEFKKIKKEKEETEKLTLEAKKEAEAQEAQQHRNTLPKE